MVRATDADPTGDPVLELGSGEDTVLVRVSSKVLTLASPVFAAMLSPRFSEGQALAASSAGAPITVLLPDDDPEATLWLCTRNALDFQKHVCEEISFKVIKNIAVACDKYDMSKAFSPWSQAWMEKSKGTYSGEDCYTDMVWISYAFGHNAAFWRNTRNMILRSDPAFLNTGRHVILPDDVIGK